MKQVKCGEQGPITNTPDWSSFMSW